MDDPSLGDLSDEELMVRLSRGKDWQPLGELYRRYGAMVKSAITRVAPELDRAERDDLCHDVFLVLGKSARRYTEQLRFKAWLYSIAVKQTLNRRDGLRRRLQLLMRHHREQTPRGSSSQTSPEVIALQKDVIASALATLPRGQREVLLLHVEGFSGEEIATMLSIKPKTVWTRLHRARAALLEHPFDAALQHAVLQE